MDFEELLTQFDGSEKIRQEEIDKENELKNELKIKRKKFNHFDFINSIVNKEYSLNNENIKDFQFFMVLRGLYQNPENVSECNEASQLAYELTGLPKDMMSRLLYDFLYIRIRGGRWNGKWTKKEKYDDLELIKEVYDVGDKKALNIVNRLSKKQIKQLYQYEEKLKGGLVKS